MLITPEASTERPPVTPLMLTMPLVVKQSPAVPRLSIHTSDNRTAAITDVAAAYVDLTVCVGKVSKLPRFAAVDIDHAAAKGTKKDLMEPPLAALT